MSALRFWWYSEFAAPICHAQPPALLASFGLHVSGGSPAEARSELRRLYSSLTNGSLGGVDDVSAKQPVRLMPSTAMSAIAAVFLPRMDFTRMLRLPVVTLSARHSCI